MKTCKKLNDTMNRVIEKFTNKSTKNQRKPITKLKANINKNIKVICYEIILKVSRTFLQNLMKNLVNEIKL